MSTVGSRLADTQRSYNFDLLSLKEEDLMKCVICKKASTKPGTTTVNFERGCLTMAVKCVPAKVCPNCGEAYINEKVTAELLKTQRKEPAPAHKWRFDNT